MAKIDPLGDLRDRLALAARDNFAGVAKIGGLGGALRIAADGVLALAPGALPELQTWRSELASFETCTDTQRQVLVARGMRVVRSLPPLPRAPSVTRTATHAATQAETQAETQARAATDTRTPSRTETQPRAETETRAETQTQTRTEAPTRTETQPRTGTRTETATRAVAISQTPTEQSAEVPAKSPRRAATKAAREPDRSVVALREDRKRSANERGRDGSGFPKPSTTPAVRAGSAAQQRGRDGSGFPQPSTTPAVRAGSAAQQRGRDGSGFPLGSTASATPDPLAAATGVIRGIGPAFSHLLAEAGIHTVEDLLWLVPTRYDDARRARTISSLDEQADDGNRVVVQGDVVSARMVFARGRRWADVKLVDRDGAALQIRFFNAWAGIEKKFPVATSVCVAGAVRFRGGHPEMANPDVLVGDGSPIVTYYPRITGVPGARVKSACLAALAHVANIADEIPATVASQLHLPSLIEAVQTLHVPPPTLQAEQVDDMLAGVSVWHQRLAFGELFALATAAAMQRAARCAGTALACGAHPTLQRELADVLGFGLTGAQQRALTAIADDLARAVPMNRLLEGDVGSGKTAVAFGAALAAVRAGRQVAVMAPTEVLAEQHEKNMRRWGAPLGVRVALLTASTPSGIRNSTLSLAAAGAVDIVIGTHALLAERVGFANLALVVIDEQQRFGVAQRMKLRDKGGTGVGVPHLLVMTATPIPRTLALTAFGDLDRTVLDELPPGRTPITTKVVSGKTGWNQAVTHMRATLRAGNQVYVVCPRIEADPEAPSRSIANDAESVYQRLTAELTDVAVGLVHGRQDAGAREATMRGFRDGSVAVLVATTVIEVGVDNPNASVMLILGADRFGLSQLHQLRGRVGRGAAQSTCWLHANSEPTPEGKQRLAALVETSDGFKIAERDLQLRGPGELFGEQQAGSPRLAIGDQALYIELLVQARAHASPLVAADPSLRAPAHALLRAAVQRRIGTVFDAQSG